AIKGEPLQVLRSVRIVAEDRLALVAAGNHMVEPAGNLESLRTRHRGTIIAQWETDPIDTHREIVVESNERRRFLKRKGLRCDSIPRERKRSNVFQKTSSKRVAGR